MPASSDRRDAATADGAPRRDAATADDAPRRDAATARPPRDLRLDIFRGAGMCIILFAHIPNNAWAGWIPARFGFSDATEIFVFCSGIASGLAFGRAFDRVGLALGTARIAHRVWQIYWAHIGVFLAVVAAMSLADRSIEGGNYLVLEMHLGAFVDDPGARISEFLTLTYVPNYFDILPMYLVVLAMVPAVMVLERFGGRVLVLGAIVALWAIAGTGLLDLPAEAWQAGRTWFFNPFSWQLLFFAGFGFSRGWLRAPQRDPLLVAVAIAVIVASAVMSCRPEWDCYGPLSAIPGFADAQHAIIPLGDKTHLGAFRLLHFAAIAYLALILAGAGGARLAALPGASSMALVGRQTLPVFVVGLWLAQVFGVVLDLLGRSAFSVTLVNVGGCVLLVVTAAVCEWFKREPWLSVRPRDGSLPAVAVGNPVPATAQPVRQDPVPAS